MTTVSDAHTVPAVTDDESESDQPRRRRHGLLWLALAGVVIAAAGVGAWLWVSDASPEPSPAATGPAATATVERGTISATDSWDGTLDHGSPLTVTSATEGTITRLVSQGESVGRGDELFRLDERPVVLLLGVVPMFRSLGPGDSGADVEQLEASLAELGYGGFTVDDQYTPLTAAAVRAWQDDIGAEPTGMLTPGDLVFVPEPGRVDALRVDIGDRAAPGTAVLDLTSDDQVVSFEVDVDDRDRFEVGAEVTVVLPGGDEVAGTVGTTAVVEVRSESTTDDTESILQVEVALAEAAPDEFVGAPVDVVVAVDERPDVLLVPVNALLALAEGGYGLEVVAEDGITSIVPVQAGLFAQGKVEVRAAGVAEGTVVGVAGR